MKKRGPVIVFFIIIALLLCREYIPYVTSRIPLLGSVLLLLITYVTFTFETGIRPYVKYAAMFSIPIFDIFASIVSIVDESFIALAYGFAQIYVFAIVGEYLIKKGRDNHIRGLYLVLLLILTITTITTYFGNLAIPGASRNMATGLIDDRDLMAVYTNLNIGGFSFVYTLVLVLPFLFYVLRFYSGNLFKKTLMIGVLLFDFLVIYTTEYSTAILCMVLSVFILFLPPRLSYKNTIWVSLSIIIVGIILSYFLPSMLNAFSSASDSYNVSVRMGELGKMMSGSTTSGAVQGRINLWRLSWNNFIHHPLFGTGTNGGGHSFLLDTLSKYGLVGLLLAYLQYKTTYRLFVKPYLKTDYCTLFIFVYVLNMAFSIVNTYYYYNIFLLFIPLFISYHSPNTVIE